MTAVTTHLSNLLTCAEILDKATPPPSPKKYHRLSTQSLLQVKYRQPFTFRGEDDISDPFVESEIVTRTITVQNLKSRTDATEPKISYVRQTRFPQPSPDLVTQAEDDIVAEYDPDNHKINVMAHLQERIRDVTICEIVLSPSSTVYDPEGPEVASFMETLHRSNFLSKNYTEDDWEFVKTTIAPRLLSARDRLIDEHAKDPDSMHFATNKTSAYLQIDYSSLPDTSFLKRHKNLSISVRIHPTGMIVLNLPTLFTEGGEKKVRLSILTSVDKPNIFSHKIKQSLLKCRRTIDYALERFDAEFRNLTKIIHPNVGVIPYTVIKTASTVPGTSSKITKAFVEEMVPLSEYCKDLPLIVTQDRLFDLMDDLFTIILGVLSGANHLFTNGLLHNDYKCANILLCMAKDPSGNSYVVNPVINDFGHITSIDDDKENKRNFGTRGYYLQGRGKSLSSEIYGLGKTFEELLSPFMGDLPKISSEGTEPWKQLMLATCKERAFDEISKLIAKMTQTTSLGRFYDNSSLSLEEYINKFTEIETKFSCEYATICAFTQEEIEAHISRELDQKLGRNVSTQDFGQIVNFLIETCSEIPAYKGIDIPITSHLIPVIRERVNVYISQVLLPKKQAFLDRIKTALTNCCLQEFRALMIIESLLRQNLTECLSKATDDEAVNPWELLISTLREVLRELHAFESQYLKKAKNLEDALKKRCLWRFPIKRTLEAELESLKAEVNSRSRQASRAERTILHTLLSKDAIFYELLKHRKDNEPIYFQPRSLEAFLIMQNNELLIHFGEDRIFYARWHQPIG